MSFSEKEKTLLYSLQRGLPLEPRPLALIGSECGFTETEVAEFIARVLHDGAARRLGAIFDGRRLGYRSVLCAFSLPDAKGKESVAASLVPISGVTHCYERGWPPELDPRSPGGPNGHPGPNLWFTLSVPERRFETSLRAVREITGVGALLVLPARTRFKIDVVFDPRTRDRDERFPGAAVSPGAPAQSEEPAADFTARERAVVRLLQEALPPVPDIFGLTAETLGMRLDELLALLVEWRARGILRRVALVVRHASIGFTANAMCVWSVPKQRIGEAGRRLAACPEVTHCYERPAAAAFPYNLYAMIHAGAWDRLPGLFTKIQDAAGLKDGRMLCSLREFKKSSMKYFADEE